jgi:RNA:NAD 2'-phosphotransferase (TPT1/KptA family)
MSEKTYLYHGTTKDKLDSIKKYGLMVNQQGKVWLTPHEIVAALRAAGGKGYDGVAIGDGVVLRISENNVRGAKFRPDRPENIFCEDNISPDFLEIGRGRGSISNPSHRATSWVRLTPKRG